MLAVFGWICKHALVLDKEAVKHGFTARLLTRESLCWTRARPPDAERKRKNLPSELIIKKCLSCDIEPIYPSMGEPAAYMTNIIQTGRLRKTTFVKK